MAMESVSNSMFSCVLISFLLIQSCHGTDTISQNQTLAAGETLVSSGETFVLGFFPVQDSTNRYLGIWYKRSPQTIVWVANRVAPLTDLNGVLTINSDGNLVLLNGTKSIIWSSNSSSTDAQTNLVAQLLDSGNLVLRRKDGSYIWQSFDFMTDTILPGMKEGTNFQTGQTWYLTSWKNQGDPSPGEFTYKIDNIGLPQFVLRQGSAKKFRSGSWNGQRFSGYAVMESNIFDPIFVYNDKEVYYSFEMRYSSTFSRLTLNSSGTIQRYVLNEGSSDWLTMYILPYDMCGEYGKCGPNGICRINNNPICQCLEGFVPKLKQDWDVLNWTAGCIRRTPLDCKPGEGFTTIRNVKLPDLLKFWLNQRMTIQECKTECLKNCSCIAFASSNVTNGGSGCLMWFGDLIDIQEYHDVNSEQDIYLRMPKSELDAIQNRKNADAIQNRKNKKVLFVLVIPIVSGGMLMICFVIWCMIQRRKKKRGMKTSNDDIELPLYQLDAVITATKSFSFSNIIGEGGFGAVYKGRLETGVEIAVKRLSQTSNQGLGEFKNEVILVSSLQHRNLVRLLGCCLDGNERMLIYEYMPNRSLDYFIFDQSRKKLLAWKNRFEIALGISRGLLYLHQDSRLRIIHRDLKASNVLLDSELNPKISDFGIAKSFGGDQTEGKTRTVIGTYGYMSPEYAFSGTYSIKSDVFSLGVVLLELVSGRRNRILDHSDQHLSLLGHAWLLWNEDNALQLMDECLKEASVESQVLKCIQVALLCVQKHPEDRPTVAAVVFMLSNENVPLPQPKHPGFFLKDSYTSVSETSTKESLQTENAVTITVLEGR